MLRITSSTSAEGAVKYYEEGLSKEDYYLEDREIVPKWIGKGAAKLGLHKEQTREEFAASFKALVHNQTPLGFEQGKRLTVRNVRNRKPGYDFTFNAPKSASVVYAITKDAAILKAHQNAAVPSTAFLSFQGVSSCP